MYRKILMPTDGSACASHAIEQGLELARRLGSEVLFLHVLENPLTTGYAAPETLPYSAQLYEDLKSAARGVLDEAARKAADAGVVVETRLVENRDPVQAIHEAEEECDAVIMGTHGRRGFNRWMFGSVAEGALRRSSKPFLVIRSHQEE
ncbi:MAG TPA: universal stress protein [Trueperaceae bacterium]|nr:universal stress protein [Trueperaceae bacterium]